jgi:maleylacetoacetate isomerase
MSEQLRLYSYWRSSAAYRVRIGLNLKGLRYETLPVHLVRDGGQQHQPEYVAKNPQHMVPTLLHGERVIRQSLAILEYLDEAWPSPRLLPMTARDRARVRGLAQIVASDIHPLNNLRVLQYFDKNGQTPGLADCCLVPQVFNARRFGVDMAPFPTLVRIDQACLALPAFEQARPERQPDAQL